MTRAYAATSRSRLGPGDRERLATASGDYLLLQDADGHQIVGNLAPVPVEGRWFNIEPQRDPVTGRRHKERVIRAKGRVLADGSFVVVGQDTYPLREVREIIVRGFVTCLLATIALALTIGGLMSAMVARRLRGINSATEKIVRSDLSRRLPFRDVGGDEFDQLARHINCIRLDQI